MSWQEKEREKRIEQYIETKTEGTIRKIIVKKVKEFWDRIIDANEKLYPELRLENKDNVMLKGEEKSLVYHENKYPQYIYLGTGHEGHISYDSEEKTLYLVRLNKYYTVFRLRSKVIFFRLNNHSIDTLLRNICVEDYDYEDDLEYYRVEYTKSRSRRRRRRHRV
ncbi:MAG TPA: hypothetical protein VEI46_09380 [Thermodesulfovibrionales bacterium]|nr:hypothetical protein [Thermodesulfovibrionales bacterium]